MAGINGYIQVEIKGKMAICHFFPPKEGGKIIDFAESEQFLTNHGFRDFDKTLFRKKVMQNTETEMSLGLCDGYEFMESMFIRISLDHMKATCRFLPPSKRGNVLTFEDIMGELERKGVTYGVSQEAIMDFLNDRKYATDYEFAVGDPPRIGRDGKIEYFFNTNPNLRPKYREDGSVDYHDLNMISNVEVGDLLARLIPEDPGTPGIDVYGREIPVRKVNAKKLKFGRKIKVSDDRTEIFSEVRGHVKLETDGTVYVSDVYEIPADVDNSTGNIEFAGNVHVKGNVISGFSVVAQGDVIVDGVVEAALIQAGGQVVVKRGIHGMQKGIIDAQGNVIIQFVENATIFSGGYVESGSIIFSEVNASQDVIVNERKGFINGGTVRAGGKVEAHTIGSDMGTQTHIEVGMAPEKKEQYVMLQRSIAAKNQKINKLTPIINTYQDYVTEGRQLDEKNTLYLNQIMDELSYAKQELQQEREVFNSLHQELLNSQHSKVIVRRDIFPGVSIVISDMSINVSSKRSFCQFQKTGGEIRVSNL